MVVAVVGVNGSVSDSLADWLTRRLDPVADRLHVLRPAGLRARAARTIVPLAPERDGRLRVLELGSARVGTVRCTGRRERPAHHARRGSSRVVARRPVDGA